jgi:hypothetical protein
MHLLTVIRQADNFNHAQMPFDVKGAGLMIDECGDDGTCSMKNKQCGSWGGGARVTARVFGAVSSVFP